MADDDLIHAIATETTEWRRELHRHPQTMYEETFASELICRKLAELRRTELYLDGKLWDALYAHASQENTTVSDSYDARCATDT